MGSNEARAPSDGSPSALLAESVEVRSGELVGSGKGDEELKTWDVGWFKLKARDAKGCEVVAEANVGHVGDDNSDRVKEGR